MKRRASSGLRTFVVSLLAFAQILIAIPMATPPVFAAEIARGDTTLGDTTVETPPTDDSVSSVPAEPLSDPGKPSGDPPQPSGIGGLFDAPHTSEVEPTPVFSPQQPVAPGQLKLKSNRHLVKEGELVTLTLEVDLEAAPEAEGAEVQLSFVGETPVVDAPDAEKKDGKLTWKLSKQKHGKAFLATVKLAAKKGAKGNVLKVVAQVTKEGYLPRTEEILVGVADAVGIGSLSPSWTQYGGRITVPCTANQMYIQFWYHMSSGWAGFDDVSLIKVGTSTNIAPNPSFEAGTNWITTPSSVFPATSAYRSVWGDAAPRTGSYAYHQQPRLCHA